MVNNQSQLPFLTLTDTRLNLPWPDDDNQNGPMKIQMHHWPFHSEIHVLLEKEIVIETFKNGGIIGKVSYL